MGLIVVEIFSAIINVSFPVSCAGLCRSNVYCSSS